MKQKKIFFIKKKFHSSVLICKKLGDHILFNIKLELYLGNVGYVVQLHSKFDFYYL